MQGENAPQQLVSGINYFNKVKSVDVIIIGRGGGSLEDLWAFNDERLARAVYASEIPVISAVGHEVDFTICDFVADVRAPTPSAAAELVVPDTSELKQRFRNAENKLGMIMNNYINTNRSRIENYKTKNMESGLTRKITDMRMNVVLRENHLNSVVKLIYNNKKNRYMNLISKLEILNPLSILTMGYSVAYGDGKKVIKSVDDVNLGENINIKIADGEIKANVTEKISLL